MGVAVIQRMRRRAPVLKNREGLTIVELTVALTFLAIVLTSVAGMTVEAAQRAQSLAGQTRRQAAMAEEINRLTALPWAQLTPTTGFVCRTVNDPGFVHARCFEVTTVNPLRRQVRIILTPKQPGLRPDTIVFARANPPTLNPLWTP